MEKKILLSIKAVFFTAAVLLLTVSCHREDMYNFAKYGKGPLRLVYTKTADTGNTEIFIIDIDGRREQQLTRMSGIYSSAPSCSADGEHIVFVRVITNSTIWIMDFDGDNQRQISSGIENDYAPSWSPDGKKIVFNRNGLETYTMNADGSGITLISAVGGFDCSWSPDGTKLVYSNPAGDIYSMNSDGTGVVQITSTTWDGNPTWSPDGTKIAFVDTHDPMQVWIMNSDGSGRVQVTYTASPDGNTQPAWSPDGKYIAFWEEASPYSRIYVINPDGSGLRLLLQNGETEPCFLGMPR